MSIKVATYNIASGGFLTYASSARLPERLELLKQVIKEIDAAIVGLTDTFRWRDVFSKQEVQDIFGYPHAYHVDMNDTRVDKRIGMALLSRFPITSIVPVRLHNRDGLKAKIALPKTGTQIEVIVAYLDDLSEATRLQEVQALVDNLDLDRPIIVMGDLNALWPDHVEVTKQAVQEFVDGHPEFAQRSDYQASLRPMLENLYRAEVLPLLQKYGLTEPRDVPPTAMTSLHAFTMPKAIFRVDHILVKNCSAQNYHVYNDKGLHQTASDHYPLSAFISL